MDGTVKRAPVKTPGGAYEVVVGAGTLPLIEEKRGLLERDVFALVVNETVLGLHGEYIHRCLGGYRNFDTYVMPDGEEQKSYRHAERAFDWLLGRGVSRRSTIVGIGGGVTGDFAGYLAALYMRGISVIHVPTTLLAMVDSSVGGKVAVNLSAGKNIVGAFHQPEIVIADVEFLRTLPDNEMRNGLAEAVTRGGRAAQCQVPAVELNGLARRVVVAGQRPVEGVAAIGLEFDHIGGHGAGQRPQGI